MSDWPGDAPVTSSSPWTVTDGHVPHASISQGVVNVKGSFVTILILSSHLSGNSRFFV